jgi:predicted outer membrane lipoprotein
LWDDSRQTNTFLSRTLVKIRKIPAWVSGPLVAGAFGVLLWLEHRRPLRRSMEQKLTRNARNLAVAGLAAATLQIAERPIIEPLTVLVERRGWGLLKRVRFLPAWAEALLAIHYLSR